MSLLPIVQRVLVTPPFLPSKAHPPSLQLQGLYDVSRCSNNSNNNNNHAPPLHFAHTTVHPVQPWVATICQHSHSNLNKLVCVYDTTASKQVLFQWHWLDLAALLYHETDAKKLPAAAKSLGTILHLQFWDHTVQFWSRLPSSSRATKFHALCIQTDKRVMVLNLTSNVASNCVLTTCKSTLPRKALRSVQPILAHLCEKTTGSLPSSNVLGLTDHWLLFGCDDGSMKVYDTQSSSVIKKIKGLKGDCVTRLLAANPYDSNNNASNNSSAVYRILTVTRKSSVYLIRVVFEKQQQPQGNSHKNNHTTIEILPPTARFQLDAAGANSKQQQQPANDASNTTTFSYHPHTNQFHWLVPTTTTQQPLLYVWDLGRLEHSDTLLNTLLKPDPTLIVSFCAASSMGDDAAETGNNNNQSTEIAVVSGVLHPAFSPDTTVSVSVSSSGDLLLHGATPLATNTTTKVQATPVVMVHLKQLLLQSLGGDVSSSLTDEKLVVYGVYTSPLGPPNILVNSNWGLLLLHLPIRTHPRASICLSGSRHVHIGAGLGSLGKSTLYVNKSNLYYASLDHVLNGNPSGHLELNNPVVLYESPVSQHLGNEVSQRPFRLAPVLYHSPSGLYIGIFWPAEFKYEIVHVATLLTIVEHIRAGGGNNSSSVGRRNPVVASGTGVSDFCWLTDCDVFAVLHAKDLQEDALQQIPKPNVEAPGSFILTPPNLKKMGAGAANLATGATKLATTAAVNTTMTVTKGATTVAKGATTAANKTVGATTKALQIGAKGVATGVKKSFGIFSGKKKNRHDGEGGSIMTANDDDDEEDASSSMAAAALKLQQVQSVAELEASLRTSTTEVRQRRYIELKSLEAIETQSAELTGGIPAATCTSLGEMSLRGGNRIGPTVMFGGPVLCVASRTEDGDGQAHFYTRKSDDDHKAESYQSSGPTLPYPDLVVWDDDGRLCAVVVENRVAVYLSEAPEFILLGSVCIGTHSAPRAGITSAKFVHGALYCCTWNSVHCVMLGDLNGGVCRLDTYCLAATDDVLEYSRSLQDDEETPSTFPVVLPLPLVQPSVLGYQSGSLIVSSLRGVHAIPLSSPLMRIGLFLASGQIERATKWFDGVPESDHETLAKFLERRGYPELVLNLPGLSLETVVDFSMRYGIVDRLEEIVETYGVEGLRMIDMGRGVSRSIFGPEPNTFSVVVCVGAYLMAHGRVELTRRLATECLRSGEEGKKDAFMLGTLLLNVDKADATRLIQRAVADDINEDWEMGQYVKNYVLANNNL